MNEKNGNREIEINGNKIKAKDYDLIVDAKRWKNRRRMAWISLFSIIGIILLLFFAPIDNERLGIITTPLSTVCFALTGVIAAYIGFTTVEKTKMGR